MNKAFTREPDEPDDLRCPHCGVIGSAVSSLTITHHLREGDTSPLSSSACFCPTHTCPIAYFDGFGQSIAASSLNRPIYPKDPAAPVCACFRLKAEDVEADAKANNPAGIRELIRKSQMGKAKCEEKAADGRCCVGEVQRLYLKAKQAMR
ncbi:MAG: hypothetical protein WD768_00265 [Phycisphaeraceae bacterium]